ncbi:MAG: hypothetical protein WCQ41_06100 [Bacillota bacterium]
MAHLARCTSYCNAERSLPAVVGAGADAGAGAGAGAGASAGAGAGAGADAGAGAGAGAGASAGAPAQTYWSKRNKKEANLYTFRFFFFDLLPFSGALSESQKFCLNLYTKMPFLYTNSPNKFKIRSKAFHDTPQTHWIGCSSL